MKWINSSENWGAVSMVFHWVGAMVVVGLFALGLWMDSLDYYSEWYQLAPNWHKSIGVIFVSSLLLRLLWRLSHPSPKALTTHTHWEKRAAKAMQCLLYVLLFSMFCSGYLIVTASGQSLEVFNWFSLPALVQGPNNLEDFAGEVHELIAFLIIGLASLHALAALKHHFLDKDRTLSRMFGAK